MRRWRMKNRFGRRYLLDKEFLDYGQDLDLFVDHPSKSVLEFAEKHGLLTPVARIRFPPEIARRWCEERYPQEDVSYGIEGDRLCRRRVFFLGAEAVVPSWRGLSASGLSADSGPARSCRCPESCHLGDESPARRGRVVPDPDPARLRRLALNDETPRDPRLLS